MNSQIEMRKAKWARLLDPKSPENTAIIINLEKPDAPKRPWPYPENIDERIDWAAGEYERRMEQSQWLEDDFVPAISVYSGTEIFAEAFGCRVHYSGDNMPFALPMLHSAREVAHLRVPGVYESTLERHFEIASRLIRRVGSDALIQIPDIQSPVDIAALVWEKGDFLASLIETPSAVKELVDKTETLLTLFLDEWFKCHGTEYIAHYPFFPMRGGFTFSEDEVGEFSPAMFREFCLPSINRLSRRYGGCSMHCCANSRHQWPAFLEIEGLRLLNLCQPEGEINDASLYFSDRVCQYHYCGIGRVDEQNGVPAWVRALPNTACVVIETTAHSRAEAQEQLRVLRAFERARKI